MSIAGILVLQFQLSRLVLFPFPFPSVPLSSFPLNQPAPEGSSSFPAEWTREASIWIGDTFPRIKKTGIDGYVIVIGLIHKIIHLRSTCKYYYNYKCSLSCSHSQLYCAQDDKIFRHGRAVVSTIFWLLIDALANILLDISQCLILLHGKPSPLLMAFRTETNH
jgi:hypothetical protein